MRVSRRTASAASLGHGALALLLLFACAGCDALFNKHTDLGALHDSGAVSDGGDGGDMALRSGSITGQVCALIQLHDLTTCSTSYFHGPLDLQVLETGTTATVQQDGQVLVGLSNAPAKVTLRLSDPRGQLFAGLFTLPLDAPRAALPMLSAEVREQLRASGIPLSQGKGALLAYVVDGNGRPLSRVNAAGLAPGTGIGPYYLAGGDLLINGAAARTDASGFLAYFELSPGNLQVTLSGAAQSSMTVPVQAGAITFSLLR